MKLYNIEILFLKNDNQIITVDTKDIKNLQICNFTDVTHIFHKLFKALTTLRLTLTLPTYVVRIII